jgi:prepilin-type N-terminal cleavage/methylation domain-containing protein
MMHVRTNRRAFTLIELLVVMIIIAVIIAIVLPVLGNVRSSARKVGTQGMLNDLNQAILQFQNDERRMPGYFSEDSMGGNENEQQAGHTELENIMLDLMGVDGVAADQPNPGPGTWIEVGPHTLTGSNPKNIKVNVDLIGSGAGGTKSYYTPDGKFYLPQTSPLAQVGGAGNTASSETAPQLKDLVDHWGQPILAWRQNDVSLGPVTQPNHFAQITSTGATVPPRFYWNSNAAFLKSAGLGRRGRSQIDPEEGSLIGSQVTPADRLQSLTAILGNPSAPYRVPAATTAPNVPLAARGKIVLHSAGVDAVYFGRKDPGAVRQFGTGPMDYRKNFVPDVTQPMGPGNQYTTEGGKADVYDVTSAFDDIMSASGN